MIELLRTNDPVLLSWLVSALRDEQVEHIVLDTHTSIMEGSIGAIPRRLMVSDDDAATARRILAVAESLAAEEVDRDGE
jgi:hypothetical protein